MNTISVPVGKRGNCAIGFKNYAAINAGWDLCLSGSGILQSGLIATRIKVWRENVDEAPKYGIARMMLRDIISKLVRELKGPKRTKRNLRFS